MMYRRKSTETARAWQNMAGSDVPRWVLALNGLGVSEAGIFLNGRAVDYDDWIVAPSKGDAVAIDPRTFAEIYEPCESLTPARGVRSGGGSRF